MADVLIKGMKMPVAGQTILVVENWDGSIHARIEESFDNFHPVIEVPDHGRLIDAGKIGLTEFEIILCQKGNPFKNALEMLLEKIENAPTIIPAEPGKEET